MDISVNLGSDTTRNRLDLLGLSGRVSSVDLDVEGNEQDEVRGQDSTTGVGSKHGTSTVTTHRQDVGQVREVSEDNLLVGSEVDEAQVQDKLDDLETGDPLLPPDSNTSGSQEIVPVHDHVHKQVQGDRNPRNRRQANQLSVAQQRGGTMVISVQKRQFFLLHHQENRVEKLTELGQVVQVVQSNQSLGPGIWVTDGIKDAMVVDHGDECFQHQHEQRQRQDGEEQVVDLEQAVQHKWLNLELLENKISAENHRVVYGNGTSHHWE